MKSFFIILFCSFLISCSGSKTVIVYLNGTKSYDEDGTIVKYSWRQINITPSANVVDPGQVITPVKIKKPGIYQFELTVTDNDGATGKDSTNIHKWK